MEELVLITRCGPITAERGSITQAAVVRVCAPFHRGTVFNKNSRSWGGVSGIRLQHLLRTWELVRGTSSCHVFVMCARAKLLMRVDNKTTTTVQQAENMT